MMIHSHPPSGSSAIDNSTQALTDRFARESAKNRNSATDPLSVKKKIDITRSMSNRMPRVENEFLEDVLESFRRRSKALKHRNAKPKIERFLDIRDDETEEIVEVRIERDRQTLRLTLWSDRYIDFWAAEMVRNIGWKFEYRNSGRFLGGIDGRSIVNAVETSLSAMFEMSDENVGNLEEIWKPLLATGPTAL